MSAAIAFIGLGNMGGAIAERLVATGHRVTGFDLSEPAKRRAHSVGVEVAASAAEAIRGAEFILSCLPNPAIVTDVWLGTKGLASSLRPGVTLIELSTIDPGTMKRVATAAPAGTRVVDCPVSGGPGEARDGRLSLIVGATDADFEFVHALLSDFGRVIHHAGPVGSGKAVKLVNNIMSMTNVLVAAEAFSLGLAYGIEPQRLFDILSVSGGTSGQFVKRFPKAIADNYEPGFALALGTKDLTLALDFARQLRVPTPATAISRELYALAESEGFGAEDHVALLKMYTNWTAARAEPRPSITTDLRSAP